jgi:hypothetical protein
MNIHVVPTNKPSRLGYLTKKGKEVYKDLRLFDILMPQILDSENQHIYITYKEEIKEGWYFNNAKAFNKPVYVKNEDIKGLKSLYGVNPNHLQKIILTDNQDLNKDGIQEIDDEFLKWFVKNPICEKIGVTFGCMEIRSCKCDSNERCLKPGYKIIIPKEEVLLQSSIDGEPIWGEAPKPMHEQIIEHCGGEEKFKEISGLKPKQECCQDTSGFYLGTTCPKCNRPFRNVIQEPKQETLEEVRDLAYYKANAEEDYLAVPISVMRYISQLEQQQGYSKEDLKEAFSMGRLNKTIKDFNETFKNK